MVRTVPTGKVKWYDEEKGFGFVSQEDGPDVYVRKTALPAGVTLKQGQRVEYGLAEGRRGPTALSVRILEPAPTMATAAKPAPSPRRPAEELHGLVEDTIKLLEARIQPDLRRGRYPERRHGKQIAELLRAIAKELDA
jgi:CspA family cold shock protein